MVVIRGRREQRTPSVAPTRRFLLQSSRGILESSLPCRFLLIFHPSFWITVTCKCCLSTAGLSCSSNADLDASPFILCQCTSNCPLLPISGHGVLIQSPFFHLEIAFQRRDHSKTIGLTALDGRNARAGMGCVKGSMSPRLCFGSVRLSSKGGERSRNCRKRQRGVAVVERDSEVGEALS